MTHLAVLTSSQIATVLAPAFTRLLVAADLTLLLPAVVVLVGSGDLRVARLEPEPEAAPPAEAAGAA